MNISIGDIPDPCVDPAVLLARAARCRRLAAGISDKQAAEVLKGMADSYQEAADRFAAESGKD